MSFQLNIAKLMNYKLCARKLYLVPVSFASANECLFNVTHTYMVRWINCHHFIFLISPLHFFAFWFYHLHSIVDSGGLSLWEKEQHEVIHSDRILVTECCTIWYSRWKLHYEHFNVGIKQRKVLLIWKALYGCNFDYEDVWSDHC